ncbi:MAG: rhomboid family intramembrane serine protease [Bacteroidales bacterium]|jgi:membrane associated rhomboid family serine protease|nr:rhomboid family intramembrane serine protease [Bacteroidales bacterium]
MDNQFRPQGFAILPLVVKNLLIINGIFFLATIAMDMVWHIDLAQYLGLHYIGASDFRPYQFVTYMFMHGSFAHLFFNMFALWMFGNAIENAWGPKRFLIFYFVCGIGAGLTQELVQYIQFSDIHNFQNVNLGGRIVPVEDYLNMLTTVGASGAVYGILLAFGMMWPNSMIYLYFLIPIKTKWFVLIYGLLELFTGFSSIDNVAHFAHVGGMVFGLLLILYWKNQGNGGNSKFKIKFNKNKSGNGRPKSDWDYNKERHDEDRKTDEILDKISRGGYDSLTKEEKEFLFKQSKKS